MTEYQIKSLVEAIEGEMESMRAIMGNAPSLNLAEMDDLAMERLMEEVRGRARLFRSLTGRKQAGNGRLMLSPTGNPSPVSPSRSVLREQPGKQPE